MTYPRIYNPAQLFRHAKNQSLLRIEVLRIKRCFVFSRISEFQQWGGNGFGSLAVLKKKEKKKKKENNLREISRGRTNRLSTSVCKTNY